MLLLLFLNKIYESNIEIFWGEIDKNRRVILMFGRYQHPLFPWKIYVYSK